MPDAVDVMTKPPVAAVGDGSDISILSCAAVAAECLA